MQNYALNQIHDTPGAVMGAPEMLRLELRP